VVGGPLGGRESAQARHVRKKQVDRARHALVQPTASARAVHAKTKLNCCGFTGETVRPSTTRLGCQKYLLACNISKRCSSGQWPHRPVLIRRASCHADPQTHRRSEPSKTTGKTAPSETRRQQSRASCRLRFRPRAAPFSSSSPRPQASSILSLIISSLLCSLVFTHPGGWRSSSQ